MTTSNFKIIPGLLLCLSMSIPQAAKGQKVWRNAEIFLTTGETLKGQVLVTDASPGSAAFTFRNDDNSPEKTYSTAYAKGYKTMAPDRVFDRFEATLNYYSKSPVRENGNPVVERDSIRVFAEILFSSSSLSFYKIIDKDNFSRFFVKRNGVFIELINVKYPQLKDGTKFTAKREDYQKQVRQIVSECETKAMVYKYSERPLIKVFEKFAHCKDLQVDFIKKKEPDLVNFGIFGGVVSSSSSKGSRINEKVAAATVQFLSKRHEHNWFLWIEAGAHEVQVIGNEYTWKPYFGAHVGLYFGQRKVQPLAYAGFANFLFPRPEAGVGLAYRKMIIVSGSAAFDSDNGNFFTGRLTFIPRLRSRS